MSRPLPLNDPCMFMLADGMHDETKRSVQKGPKRAGCYICEDVEFSLMGLPLCTACHKCQGHVAADDTRCDDCGHDSYEEYCQAEDQEAALFGRKGTDEEFDPNMAALCDELFGVKP